MCGIVGVVSLQRDVRVEESSLVNMTDSMVHRGPDGRGTWIHRSGNVGFGHRRLAIIDLSENGRQPMSNDDGSIQVTFNGEIYNFRELRAKLQSLGYRFRSQCDTEVLIHLYDHYGEEMVGQLDGDFAFGLWDDRRQQFLGARDRVGVKPFYYAQVGSYFLFASEIKALLRHPAVTSQINEEALYHYLTYLVAPSPETLIQNVHKLPAGSLLKINTAKRCPAVETAKYWRPLPAADELQDKDLDGQLEQLFAQAVDKRMMSDVPLGVLFSGGVDSSLNASYVQRALGETQVNTYTVGVTDDPASLQETRFAKQMAERLGTRHHELFITEQDMLDSAVSVLEHQDEPISDPVSIPLYFITRFAKETGTTVLHSGEGADETFCGYDNYRRFLRSHDRYEQHLTKLPSWMLEVGAKMSSRIPSPRAGKIADVFSRMASRKNLFMASAVAFYETEKQPVLSRGFRERCRHLDSYDMVAPMYQELQSLRPNASFLQKLTYIELQMRLSELLLMRVDKMSMAHGVEVRVPFLDSKLMDFALSAPQAFKLRSGISKEPLKRLAAKSIPRDLIYRSKTGFGAPIVRWFKSELGVRMLDSMRSQSADWDRYFDVEALTTRLHQGPRTTNEAFQLWVVFNFMNWRQACSAQPLAAAA